MWIIGQRVTAEFEPELGLGIVIQVTAPKYVEVLFPAAEVTRRYTFQRTPLKRHQLQVGQKARSKDGKLLVIEKIIEEKGLIAYGSGKITLWEYELDHLFVDDSPLSLLISGRWDEPISFDLRAKAWELASFYRSHPYRGFVGPRVTLLPHQFFVANEVVGRLQPRVLLSDEVGLGKTIEAGIIFSALKARGRAERVLIVVPDALKHQWLAELYRRFNELFSLVDEERSEQELLSQGKSAFSQNQRILTSIEFLTDSPDRLEELMAEKWDLVIFDEAHHLKWNQEEPEPEWDVARLIVEQTKALLLLTGTPESHGNDTLFGLLHLVDPVRFSDYKKFESGQAKMHEVSEMAQLILAGKWTEENKKRFHKFFAKEKDLLDLYDRKETTPLIKALVDRHGTGRVYFRNRREKLRGFPVREIKEYPLPLSAEWKDLLESADSKKLSTQELVALGVSKLRPKDKNAAFSWIQSRAFFLRDLITKELGTEKCLCICSSTRRALEVHEALRGLSGVKVALFHEEMEVVERDRQAAWFADPNGAQLLICSEIGGEGRNFQFCQHLVVLDIPLETEVLEQRIGRLDRIGQKKAIQIHVPFLEATPEEAMKRWHFEVIHTFQEPWGAGDEVEDLYEELFEVMRSYIPSSKIYAKRDEKFSKFAEKSAVIVEGLKKKQRESTDILLDLNSYDEALGKGVVEKVQAFAQEPRVKGFLEAAFDFFGVDEEGADDNPIKKLSAHSLTYVEHFPGLSQVGQQLVTFDRDAALAREDLAFLTLDHPITQGALSLFLERGTGKVALGIKPGLNIPVLIQLMYVMEVSAPVVLDVERDLPPCLAILNYDHRGKMLEKPSLGAVDYEECPREIASQLVLKLKGALDNTLEAAQKKAAVHFKPIIEKAAQERKARYQQEIQRLEQLIKRNRLIDPKELELLQFHCEDGITRMQQQLPRLDSVRILLNPAAVGL